MVNTLKFSDFPDALLNNSDLDSVGLENGANTKFKFMPSWSTATRPATPFNGLLGFNTDLVAYEYFDTVGNTWKQLATV